MKLTPELFVKWCEDVAEWNKVARNGEHDFSEEVIRNQERFVLEEVKEAIEAIETGNVAGKLEELADVLVTMSYLYFLLVGGDDECAEGLAYLIPAPFQEEEDITVELEGIISLLNNNICPVFAKFVLMNVYDMLAFYEQKGYNVVAIVEEVLKSNWSKFVPLSSLEDEAVVSLAELLSDECKRIEDTYNKKDVDFSFVGDYVVYRDKGGKGKIMKSYLFKEANVEQYV